MKALEDRNLSGRAELETLAPCPYNEPELLLTRVKNPKATPPPPRPALRSPKLGACLKVGRPEMTPEMTPEMKPEVTPEMTPETLCGG